MVTSFDQLHAAVALRREAIGINERPHQPKLCGAAAPHRPIATGHIGPVLSGWVGRVQRQKLVLVAARSPAAHSVDIALALLPCEVVIVVVIVTVPAGRGGLGRA